MGDCGPLAGKVALVTGAGRGIGRAIARRLAEKGARVCITYAQDHAAALEAVTTMTGPGGQAQASQLDIRDVPATRQLFDEVVFRFGKLDILVNNAGIYHAGNFQALDETTYDDLFAVTKGTYFAMQQGAAIMAGGGRIINLCTSLTHGWAVNTAAYAGSKAAIEQFTRSLSKEAGPRGITVNAVLPGLIRTDMTSALSDEALGILRDQVSLGRLGEPEDIADVVAFLASDEARWITGQLIPVNGGSVP